MSAAPHTRPPGHDPVFGKVAGAFAGDLNDSLTVILASACLALEDLPAHSPIRTRLEKIRQAAHRAALVTDRMLEHADRR